MGHAESRSSLKPSSGPRLFVGFEQPDSPERCPDRECKQQSPDSQQTLTLRYAKQIANRPLVRFLRARRFEIRLVFNMASTLPSRLIIQYIQPTPIDRPCRDSSSIWPSLLVKNAKIQLRSRIISQTALRCVTSHGGKENEVDSGYHRW